MAYNVLAFISQAARDCKIRAKDVTGEVRQSLRFPNPTLRLSGKIIAMGMGYYCRVRCLCNGFHKLFFNGLMYVLQGVVGTTLSDLEHNAELFAGGQFQMQVCGERYTLDKLVIKHTAGDEMCLLEFGEENQPAANGGNNPAANNGQDDNDSGMNE